MELLKVYHQKHIRSVIDSISTVLKYLSTSMRNGLIDLQGY